MDLKEQYDKLLRYCYAKTKNRELSEDIVQETFLRFWESRSYKDIGKEQAYLYAIARNLCMDEFRRPREAELDGSEEQELKNSSMLQRDTIEDYVTERELNIALEQLPDDLRELVILRYANEMKVVDIAEISGMSRFAVYRKLNEGLKILKNIMEGEERK